MPSVDKYSPNNTSVMYNCAISHEFPHTELLILSRNMTYLDACEEFAVFRMYNERLVFMDYKAINTVRSKDSLGLIWPENMLAQRNSLVFLIA
jgi:hypothetical protein